MKEEVWRVLLTAMALVMVFVLEIVALMKGVDGVLFSLVIAVIAILAPSPAFQIKMLNFFVKKGSDSKDR
ncbi:MAG: hypothetical protein QW166_05120 [Candidatus Bathyarchaeia archaeon]